MMGMTRRMNDRPAKWVQSTLGCFVLTAALASGSGVVFAQTDEPSTDAQKAPPTSPRLERQPALRDGKLVFLVTVGRYATFEQAEADLLKIKRHRGDAFITTTR